VQYALSRMGARMQHRRDKGTLLRSVPHYV
jgi:hypothetical protein